MTFWTGVRYLLSSLPDCIGYISEFKTRVFNDVVSFKTLIAESEKQLV